MQRGFVRRHKGAWRIAQSNKKALSCDKALWQGKYIEGDLTSLTVQQSAAILDPDSAEAMINEQIQQNRNNYISDLLTASDDAAFDAKWDEFMAAHEALNPKACEDYINERYIKLKAEYEEAMAK